MGESSNTEPITLDRQLDETKVLAAELSSEAITGNADRQLADAVCTFVNDTIDIGAAGQFSQALAMADVATILWSRFMRFDAAHPFWPDSDRIICSGSGEALLFAALSHLTRPAEHTVGAIEQFERMDRSGSCRTDFGEQIGNEAVVAAPGQGLATAVGAALAERMLASKFGRSLVNHRTWVFGSDADLMEGINHEAVCLAGHLRLGKLTVLWNDANGSRLDPLKQVVACGWATKRVDSDDTPAIVSALSFAVRGKKPTLIACRPSKNARSRAGAAVVNQMGGGDGLKTGRSATRPHGPELSKDVRERCTRVVIRGTAARRSWLKRLHNHALRAEFDRVTAGRLPDCWSDATAALKLELADTCPVLPTWQASQRILQGLSAMIPELVGGAPEMETQQPQGNRLAPVTWDNFGGRVLHFGLREQGMAACLNGMALHNGLIPHGAAPLVYTDAMRPAFRAATFLRRRIVFALDQDNVGQAQDAGMQNPVEQLACLRATRGLSVLRPADGIETVECWELALRRGNGPTLLVLSHHPVPAVRSEAGENRCARGGYVLAEADGPRQATLIATGSEVALALHARRELSCTGIAVAVVSLPCWDLFAGQDESYRNGVLGAVLRVGVEAACGFGWERWLGTEGIFIGVADPGAGASAKESSRHHGITPGAIVSAVRTRLQHPLSEGT